jgi:hypothetical protein
MRNNHSLKGMNIKKKGVEGRITRVAIQETMNSHGMCLGKRLLKSIWMNEIGNEND